ncbi:AbrB family transcriptional regulator [Ancylobacter sp. MQZ15Z-1]|uniref:AbrB family transcriptional regulator n=1 Tax=Ancylobacter mangrovi TaxID=2972472 RepID=A0A9X2T1K5_9HYPH|nr:AbrB family transcriptional regulator [Ancylobacter mangrovi]MCS0494797.1 AbrB family transcriptional regulator [Ancylobacter mangrovi]
MAKRDPSSDGPGTSPSLAARFAASPPALQWAAVLVVTVVVTAAFLHFEVPAGGLLGPMFAAAAFCGIEHRIRVSRGFFHAGQCAVGCLIASTLPAEVLLAIPDYATEVVVASALTLTVSLLIAKALVVTGTVDVRAAVWGMLPGGASAMIAIADASGADARLVAFMQYLRVASVAATAAMVAHYLSTPGAAPVPVAHADGAYGPYAVGAGVYVLGLVAARFLPIPAGAMLLPMLIGIAVQAVFGLHLAMPQAVLLAGYALIGWSVGLRFEPRLLRAVLARLPQLIAATVALIALCGLVAVAVSLMFGLDPMTCYLAMSPGGIDTVAIIATGIKANLAFVLAVQATRMLVTLLVMPPAARALLRRAGHL